MPLVPAHLRSVPRGQVTLAPLSFVVDSYRRFDSEVPFYDGRESFPGYELRVVVIVAEREGRGEARLTFNQQFPASVPEAAALRELLHTAMTHEADECIYVDGRRVFDPHRQPEFTIRMERG